MTTVHDQRRGVARAAAESVIAVAALALVTWVGTSVHAHAVPAAILYLCLVVLASLRGRLTPALVAAVGGTIAWDLVFTAQQVTPAERLARGAMMLAAFGATAIVITRLVTALRTSEHRWRHVFENNPTMYFIVEAEGTVLSVNPFGAESLGYTPEELIGRSVLDVFPDESKAAARAHVARCLTHLGRSLSWELQKVRKDGTRLWVRETARAVQRGGEPPVVLIACEDITELHEAQDQLRASEARLRGQASLLDLTHDAIFVRDANDVIIYWNRGAEEQYGWSSEEAVGRVSHELMRTVFPEPLEGITAALLRVGRWEGELVHTRRDGARIGVASRWSLTRDDSGAPAGVLETNNDVTRRKRAEEELRRSEAYLSGAQRLSHTGSFGWHVSDGTIYWSDETYRIFGVERDTRPSVDLVLARAHADDRLDVQRTIERAQQSECDFEHEYRVVLPDGSVRHLHVVARAVRNGAAQLEFVGAVMDVTERKRAEEEHQTHVWFLESMDRVNRAVQGANDIEQMMGDVLDVTLSVFGCDQVWLVYPCDPDAPSWRAVMARSRPQFPVTVSAEPEGVPVSAENASVFRAARASASPVRLDARTDPPLSDGARRHGVQSALATALTPKVDAPYLFALHQCSHARAWTEREERLFQEIGRRLADALTTRLVLRDLRESAQRYRNIFQTAAVSIWEEDFSRVRAAVESLRAAGVRDFRGYFAEHPEFVAEAVQKVRVVDVNDTTLTMFGARSKDELLDSLERIFTPETLHVFAGELLAVAEGKTFFSAEAPVQTVNGERLDVLITIAFPPESTTLDSVLVSIMDITGRKRAEEALQRARGELARASTLTTMGELAGSIAHELRQPLAAISMNGSATLRWLNRETPDLAEAREAASRIVREARRADEVIRSLRGLLERSELRRAPFDVGGAVREVLGLVGGELRRNDVTIDAALDADVPPALGDRVQLQQVVLNLVMNGIEAMAGAAGGGGPRTLAVRAERAGPLGVAVVVEDTGPGLDPAAADRIFEPFFTTKPSGLGLGLSICRSIVEAHGGELTASPRRPSGTTFRFTVPAATAEGPPSLTSAAAQQPASRLAGPA